MYIKKKNLTIVVLINLCSLLYAGEEPGQKFNYRLSYGQNLNSYQWMTNFNYNRLILGKTSLLVSEDFKSSLIRLGGINNKWKDDQKLSLKLFYPFSQKLGLTLFANANQFSDKLSGLVSDIKTNASTIGMFYYPIPKIKVISAAGYKYDNRLEKTDQGITYAVDITTDTLVTKQYQNRFNFLSNGDRYSFRKNNDFQLTYRVKKYFQQDTYDSLSVYWTKKRRDNYNQVDLSEIFIESLEEENKGFHHFLAYGNKQNLYLKIRTSINSRTSSISKYLERSLVDERSKTEFHSENKAELFLSKKKIDANCSLAYITNSQKNEVPDSLKSSRFSKYFYYISPDFKSSRITLAGTGKFKFSRSDTLSIKGAVSRYRYDTPENNPDDRDEFRMNIHLSEIHYFFPRLKLVLNGSVNLYHLVYIYSERSANNNWMRIFRLSPQVIYRPTDGIKIVQNAEVLANYVDYDYEIATSTLDVRSYVFRRFMLEHRIYANLTHTTAIQLNYKFEIEENGKLNWDNWTEVLLTNRKNHWFRFNFTFKSRHHFYVSPGVIIFKRVEKNQEFFSLGAPNIKRSGNLFSYGPSLNVTYQPHQRMSLRFEGMRRVVEEPYRTQRFLNFINLKLTWYQ